MQIFAFALITSNSYAQLSGNYTIGGANPDYNTVLLAISDIETNGVNGSVIFNIRTGTYTGLHTIHEITGSSAVNTITFQSETGVNTDVNLQNNGKVIALSGADYISFITAVII